MQSKQNVVLFLLFLATSLVFGQQKNKDKEEEQEEVPEFNYDKRNTNNVENQLLNPTSLNKKEEKFIKMKMSNTKHTYIGNLCAEEITRKYHFVYDVDHVAGMGHKIRYFVGNQFKVFYLNFKNGIFWRYRFKKELRNCISRSGDYIG